MKISKSGLGYRAFPGLLAGCLLWTLSFAGGASAQSAGTIDAGTTIAVRTSEGINVSTSDGRVFSGVVDQDVVNRNGSVAIPRGANVEMLVKTLPNKQLALDLEAVTVNGRRYGLESEDSVFDSRDDGLGANKRTGKYVGGGAAIGAIIGAIAGGGKGAAIGGGVGAAAGAGTQVLTRGKTVKVPAESLLTFRLEQPLQTVSGNSGFMRNGQRYRPGYRTDSGNSAAYQDGLMDGRSDADGNLPRNGRSNRWTSGLQLREYQAGYTSGYDRTTSSAQQNTGSIRIASNNNVSWTGPATARLFVQVDNNPRQLFASGASGTQLATWMTPGHLYVFVMEDPNGNEIARDQNDLRQRRTNRAR